LDKAGLGQDLDKQVDWVSNRLDSAQVGIAHLEDSKVQVIQATLLLLDTKRLVEVEGDSAPRKLLAMA
jgi:hypothetical protein